MADLAGWGDVLRAVNILYWVVAAAAIYVAWRWPSKRVFKFSAAGLVALVFVVPALIRTYNVLDYKIRYSRAKAVFDERCKTAGERVNRVVSNVEGVRLPNIRPAQIDHSDQFSKFDPYGYDFGGDAYIASYLWGRAEDGSLWEAGTRGGFSYVDALSPTDSRWYRYTVKARSLSDRQGHTRLDIEKTIATEPLARYSVEWTDLSTKEDRDNWIAGGSLRIIDTWTNEVLGERKGFLMDAGLGSHESGRSPWLFAQQTACPPFPTIGASDSRRRRPLQLNRNFIETVLHPKVN